MKRLTILFVVLCLAVPMFSASKAKTQYVTIDPAPLKAKPAASSKKVGSIEYASAVIVLKEEKAWVYVQLVSDKSVEGWLPAPPRRRRNISASLPLLLTSQIPELFPGGASGKEPT